MKFRIAMAMMLAIIVLCATVQAGGRTKAINPPNDDNPNYTIPHSIGRGITDDIADSPGDTLGTTYYEYQSNGNVGNKVAKDELGGYHFCWMNGVGSVSGNRHVSYNFIDENGNRAHGNVGTYVNLNEGAGYTNLDVFSDSRAAVAFHNANNFVSTLGTDVGRGFGLFTLHDIPDVFPGSDDGYWPYCTIDNQDRIHVTCKINGEPSIALYTRSDDLGQNWTNTAVIDTLGQVGTQPVSSFVSDKVAILYLKGIPGDEFGTVGDVYYIESTDGITWDFDDKHNITNYQIDDTIRAWLDFDAVYDYNDNLHIIWNTCVYSDGGLYVSSALWHWAEATGISMIALGDWNSNPGNARLTQSKPTIGVDQINRLFVTWSQYTEDDNAANGYSNGDIYACASDNGVYWYPPVNLTNSYSGECLAEECDNDCWPSMAEKVDDNIHILYINDKDGGAAVRDEGVATENPVLYLTYFADLLFPHSVDDKEVLPEHYATIDNYPNPFNSSTTINYSVESKSHVTIEIFNLLGEKISTVLDNKVNAGEYNSIWDASAYSSGIYFARLNTEYTNVTARMVLLK